MTKTRKIKGYYFDTEHNKYRAQITVSGERIHLGYFANPTQAAAAYRKAATNYR